MRTNLSRRLSTALAAASVLLALCPALSAQARSYDTPQAAVDALLKAAQTGDAAALAELFGPEGKDLVTSGDPVQDKNYIAAFHAKAQEKKSVVLDPKNSSRATLSVGNDDWPFPLPLIKKSGKWFFDAKAGGQEILYRRIGANELDAIQVCRGFVEAQGEYATLAREYTGSTQYAQRLISSPGKRDGLYWQKPDGSAGGPVSEAVARAIEEGYSLDAKTAYHGYYFKVLKGQGPAAPFGHMDYVIGGVMIGGFALIAAPAEYGVSGIKTFMVSHDGIVYEKDLGPDTLKIAKSIDRFNPDKTWKRTDDEWPPDSH
jgi:hypothetical protein